jgi:hypothetical protein
MDFFCASEWKILRHIVIYLSVRGKNVNSADVFYIKETKLSYVACASLSVSTKILDLVTLALMFWLLFKNFKNEDFLPGGFLR